jgi:hypothetical protein
VVVTAGKTGRKLVISERAANFFKRGVSEASRPLVRPTTFSTARRFMADLPVRPE